MTVNELRIVVTVLSMLVFIGIVAWAMTKKNQSRFDEAAQLPIQEE